MGMLKAKEFLIIVLLPSTQPTWPRSFTPANQEMRSLVAKMKLIPNRAMLEGKRVLFCDDSIVRGTQLRDNVKFYLIMVPKRFICALLVRH